LRKTAGPKNAGPQKTRGP